jgi:hypothetical protein
VKKYYFFVNLTIFLLSSLFVISCSPLITYKTDNTNNPNLNYERVISYFKLSKLTLSIQPLQDNRKTNSYLKDEMFATEDKNPAECYNRDYIYDKINVSDTLSELLANHFDSTKIFKKVYYNEKEQADLYMTADLISFVFHTQINKDAMKAAVIKGVASVLVGPIAGAVVASGYRSVYNYEIKYANVVVYDKKGNIIYKLPEFVSKGTRPLGSPVASCNTLEHLAFYNDQLKWHNDSFIEKINDELSKAEQLTTSAKLPDKPTTAE